VIAARKRPAAIVAVYLVEAIFAWMLAAPWAETIARTVGGHPDGDRVMFWEPGMPMLLDLQSKLGAVFAGLFAASAIGLAVYAVLSVLIAGALLAALRGDPLRRAIGRGAETYFRLLIIGAISVFAIVVVFVLVGVLPSYGLSARGGHPRTAFLVSLLPLLLAGAAIVAIAAVADLARARVVAHDATAIDALVKSARDRRALTAQVVDSLPRYLASLGLLGYAAALTTLATSVLVIFLVHQVVAVLRVALRASVLSRALRHVGEA
jgi:hypothetical protein